MAMKSRRLSGNHYEIGLQLGRRYKKKGLSVNAFKINEECLAKQLKVYRKYFPDYLEEIKGIADGGGFNGKKTQSALLTGEISSIRKHHPACTIFGIKSNKGVFVGRNYDWSPQPTDYAEIQTRHTAGYYGYKAICDLYTGDTNQKKINFGFFEHLDIINEKGLFAGVTYAYCNNWQYGLVWKDFLQLIAETCATTKQAIELFNKIPCCIPKNFFIADKNGDMAIIEHAVKDFKVIYPNEDILIQTTHYLDSNLSKVDLVLAKNPKHTTYKRYSEILEKLTNRTSFFYFEDIIKILGDTSSCVCQNMVNAKTVWAWALDMKKRKYYLYTNLFGKRKVEHIRI